MNSAVMFSKASDMWETPRDLFVELNAEFTFGLDAAASVDNATCEFYLGPDHYNPLARNSLELCWCEIAAGDAVWLNPPYSQCRQFMAKAQQESHGGATVVCLVPSRTDTRWWHDHVWDDFYHEPWPGVEVRFLKGRLKFTLNGEPLRDKNGRPVGAPFPSVLVIFRPPT